MMTLHKKILRKLDHLLHPAKGEMLMLHRVTDNGSKLQHNRQFEITSEMLEEAILNYQSKGYMFVSVDDVVSMLKTKRFPNKHFVCFTLDDGYKDNLLKAAPIFRKYNVPFCIYVATSFVTGDVALWWYILEDIIMENEQLSLADGREFSCPTAEEKNNVFSLLHDEILENAHPRVFFDSLFLNYSYVWRQKAESLALNIAELQELAKDSLCTIGAHTVSHVNLVSISAKVKQKELANCKELLSSWIGQEVAHLSYPYGASDEECATIAGQVGFSSAAQAWGGSVRSNSNLFALPRNNMFRL